MLKKILIISVVILVLISATSCSPGYVLRGAWEEVRILSRREKIETILANKTVQESDLIKLELVLRAREFAIDKGLNVGKSYSQYAVVDSSALVWVVTAAPKDKLVPLTWWFPIVGSVPYKGFFSKDDALALTKELDAKGYDTFLRPSGAFSTLGWFNDPVLSTMLKGDEISLVNTVLHELLHRTLWIPGSVEFNESLANFVGGELAREFFLARGEGVREATATSRQQEEFEFSDFIVGLSKELEDAYAQGASISGDKVNIQKAGDILEKKAKILELAKQRWSSRISSDRTGVKKNYSLDNFPLNNASILAMKTYLAGIKDFSGLYDRCDKDFPSFIKKLKSLDSTSSETLFSALGS